MKTIGKKELYRDYINDLNEELEIIDNTIVENLNLKNHYMKTIKSYLTEDIIISKNEKTIEKQELLDCLKTSSISNNGANYEFRGMASDDGHYSSFLRGFLTKVFYINAKLKGLNERKCELESYKIDRDTYYKINDIYNEEVIKYLLDGKIYSIGSRLGSLFISGRARSSKSKTIDWGESNKYKQYLIDNGQIPYSKEEHDTAIAQGKPYNGVKWHIYHYSKYVYHIKWTRPLFVKNIKLFSFIPTKHNGTMCSMEELLKTIEFKEIPNLKLGFIEMIKLASQYDNDHDLKYRRNNKYRNDLQFN